MNDTSLIHMDISKNFIVTNNNYNKYNNNMFYVKQNVSLHEYKMHKHVYDLGIVNIPEIINYNEYTKELTLRKIDNMNISDCYGDTPRKVGRDLLDNIREIIKTLYDNNIIYPDITGYNFIEYENKLWIIDFEHAYFKTKQKNLFVERFLKGSNRWNPLFK